MNTPPKKLLLLGAMDTHVPVLKRARERGIYTITCDYTIDNIGHTYADKAHYDSTTDFQAVLNLAKKYQVDAVMTFNSDPAALTAAYVAKQLGLPSSDYSAVEVMSEKDKFRQFLNQNGFNTPPFGQYTDFASLQQDLNRYSYPVMIKPVDSSGSKGITKIECADDMEEAFNRALEYSRCKRVIVEGFIEAEGRQLHGDAFIYDGKIQFIYLGDHYFDSEVNNIVPISSAFPSRHSEKNIEMVKNEVQQFITKLGFKQGSINIEARISQGKVFLIEVGPRNGGNFIPMVLQYATGFNFVDACLDVFLGLPFKPQNVSQNGYLAYMIPHSKKNGIFDSIKIAPELESKILERHDHLKPGDTVHSFMGANAAVGLLIVRFESAAEMDDYINRFDEVCQVILK